MAPYPTLDERVVMVKARSPRDSCCFVVPIVFFAFVLCQVFFGPDSLCLNWNIHTYMQVLLSDLRPEPPAVLAQAVQNLLAKMWDKHPAKRPSMEQALDELDRAGKSPFNMDALSASGDDPHDQRAIQVQSHSPLTTEATGSNSENSAAV